MTVIKESYQQTIEYLFSRLPMFSRIGAAAYKKDLTNIRILCERLGNPQTKFKSIHIGGTNGKGSVSHMLAAILQTAGYKTGLYTSPHLHDFRERVRVNGQMAEEIFVVDFVERTRDIIEEIEPSFFEITVALAFDYFARNKVKVAVIEVGLGGRLDSTNIISPELSVITNIGWDHMDMLGNSLEAIAVEKAGIIKEGIPVVIGEQKNETASVFLQTAALKRAPVFFADEDYSIHSYQWCNGHLFLDVKDAKQDSTAFELDLPGIYQRKNLCTVLASIDRLQQNGFAISLEQIQKGLKKVKTLTGLKGRWDIIHQRPLIILDVAHNREGIEQVLLQLQEMHYKQLHLIFGTVKDKDSSKVLKLLPKEAIYYFTQAHIPRALPAKELKEKACAFSLKGQSYNNVNEALQAALEQAGADDLILVCGSIFLVAEVNTDQYFASPNLSKA